MTALHYRTHMHAEHSELNAADIPNLFSWVSWKIRNCFWLSKTLQIFLNGFWNSMSYSLIENQHIYAPTLVRQISIPIWIFFHNKNQAVSKCHLHLI